MISPRPEWTLSVQKSLSKWYGHVHLERDLVIGQWFAADRGSGRLLWEKSFRRPTSIFHLTEDVILATETRSDGPWTLGFGCYGISKKSGELLWTWEGPGFWGAVIRKLDWVPGYTNEFRPRFIGVRGAECVTSRGWVLDVQTGSPIRRIHDAKSWAPDYRPSTDAAKLYAKQPVRITESAVLSARLRVHKKPDGYSEALVTVALTEGESVAWEWGPETVGLHPIHNYYGWRLSGRELIFLATSEPEYIPDPKRKQKRIRYVISNPTFYHLLIVDAHTGELLRQFPISDEKLSRCRIEDIDDRGVLVSLTERSLAYFRRE